jgi:uncharacterized protein DUF6438
MKSLKQLPVKFRSHLAASIIIMLLVAGSFTSCQKDEGLQSSATSSVSSNEKVPAGPQLPLYEVVKIDHQGVRGDAPDYEVIVSSDNIVTFIGRRNVSFIGKINFKISDLAFAELNTVFIANDFFNITEKPLYVVDAPPVYTTFNDGTKSLTLVDYNTGIPAALIKMRQQSEQLLNISKYINPVNDEAGH